MKKPQFTLRSLMVAVVIAGLATWGYRLWLRSAYFAAKASEHATRQFYLEGSLTPMLMGPPPYHISFNADKHKRRTEWARYEDQLCRKYRFAAFLPFLPVSPDPPPPSEPPN